MNITLDEMLAFKTVVHAGSISAAAELLGQTTSGVSRALGRLEHKLGATLLRRTTRRLELTEEGRHFLDQAQAILLAVEAAQDQMAQRRLKPSGKLRINAAAPFMLHVIAPLVSAFSALFPDIALELNSNDHLIDLLEQRTDVAIRIGPLKDSTLHARALGTSRLRLLASPGYLKQAGRPAQVSDLDNHRLLGFTQPNTLNTWPLRHDGVAVQPQLLASSGETLRQLALSGNGIVCLADFMTGPDREQGHLVQVLAKHTVDVRQPIHAVYYRNTELASRIQCFVDFLAARMRE